ncbi:gluconate 5-dehydrogenase [Pseudoroseomonas rhizosphaerae]|uniref:Gluconate 5-dehydrogenase n=1 Tax=Teichococcus rhizosphaerae TaxID=1335062 RepID=A0A2C7AA26_9PROT|nr:SDR family oxidoreductase [Pseudoroseomonas rhizosphaerae]PHK93906.1 gluconate 5-dehydrogenase [Pseudoroseomonas rhizosphaerae]
MAAALFDLKGRRALVTGSSQGIGLALARGLAEAGAAVVLNGRDPARLEAARAGLAATGLAAETAPFDVSDAAAAEAALEGIEARLGPVDILVNNAGITRRMPALEVPETTWHEVLRTNLDGVFFMAQAAGRRMVARGHGKIINIASVQSDLARPGTAPYATSKGGVRMLTRALCAEWAPRGVQVNAIAPGYFATELTRPLVEDTDFTAWLRRRTPAGRWGRVEELVGACVFLAAPASDFVNGQMLYVDGGLTAAV